ncbi:MAG: PEP-CTERM sorting domain-containing protein [Planctomycetota bacterium]
MKSIFSCLLFVVGSLIGFGNDAQGATVSVFVPGSANPYLAGMPNGTTAPGGDSAPGQSPLLVNGLNISQANYLSFSATGSASYNSSSYYGPDGGLFYGSFFSRGSENGISGLRVTVSSLIGVFLDSQLPTTSPAPSDLNFEVLTRDFLTLSPELKQVFFIGDGRTSSSVIQKFYVPNGATRLFLGTADGTQWVNNGGGFNTDITSYSQAAGPEPTSMAIFGLGALGLAYRSRRKSKA